ncbi:MAG: hypothetical protein DMG53_14540 [Acidobacteria bacterium]|nr:MAG: hypothetical protein DMG53_14540 [Acidobacteriota bacterium]
MECGNWRDSGVPETYSNPLLQTIPNPIDEGEGKYVQIRGTEPRLANVTIDGVNTPSPESGVRQIKLDAIPADIVESVEINKTLQANMDPDGIGGGRPPQLLSESSCPRTEDTTFPYVSSHR